MPYKHRKMRTLIFAQLFLLAALVLPNLPNAAAVGPIQEGLIRCLVNQSIPSHPISSLIFTPADSSYSPVLQSYIRNLRFNTSTTSKPLLIVTATHVSHVQASILCAQKKGIEMKVRSGGHDYEGLSYVSIVPFFMVDMFNLRAVDVNIEEETAWVQAGATLGEVYYAIANKSKTHAFPAGVCPTVGAGGHITGAGYGTLMRKYGLTVDNVIDAVIVDVHGKILDRNAMGEDLFWAILGGGGSSFCAIISYKIKLVQVPETVTVFRVSRTLDQNLTNIVDQYQRVAPHLDHRAFIRLTLDVTNSSETGVLTNRATFRCLFLGDSQILLSLVNKNFSLLGLQKSDCLEMSWIESVLFYDDFPTGTPLTTLLDRQPSRLTYLKRKSDYLKEPIPRSGLEGLWKLMVKLQTPQLTFNPYGGRMAEIPANATPFPHRAGNLFKLQYATNWNEGGSERAEYYIKLTRELHTYMTPFVSSNPREAFLNYRDLDLGINRQGANSYDEGKSYGIKYFKDNFDRLVRIKTKVDPLNFFRNEQSIPTLPPSASQPSPSEQNTFLSKLVFYALQ